ncbi:hypothetical protein [Bifidobacterium pullorum]|uniref:hypothetical protein n=1 Tax=Bifidobacterium pullorum TaxID=78448 RepID=UPI0029437133|nr:hypothetical protein [Bifidobacterium pullorum]MBS5401521.1 hypothetical protein [Bifidobacterium sp.]
MGSFLSCQRFRHEPAVPADLAAAAVDGDEPLRHRFDSCCIAPDDHRVAYAYIPDVRYRSPSIHHLQQAVNPAFPYHFPQNNAVSARIGIM